jgi:hypothetical protein
VNIPKAKAKAVIMPIVPRGFSGITNVCPSGLGCDSDGVSFFVSVGGSVELSLDDSLDVSVDFPVGDNVDDPVDVSASGPVDVSPVPSAGKFGTASGLPEVSGAVLDETKM